MSDLFNRYDISPTSDYVLVKRKKSGDKTETGLFIPESAQDVDILADVLAVGPGRKTDSGELIEPQVEKGDTVIIDTYAGVKLKLEGEELTVCREAEVIAVIKRKSDH